MQLSFEPAQTGDASCIFGFAREMIGSYETDPKLDLAMALDWTRRKIEKWINEYTRVLIDGTVAGYFRFVPGGDLPGEDWMELDDLYVLPAYRNRGVGTAILRRCLAAQKFVYLYVFTQNVRAVALYEREGFKKVEDVSPTRCIMAWRGGLPFGGNGV